MKSSKRQAIMGKHSSPSHALAIRSPEGSGDKAGGEKEAAK